MAATTLRSGDSLPNEVEDLINRRLRLMRRQEEARLSGVVTATDRAVVNHVREAIGSRKRNAAIALSTLDAYGDAARRLLGITEQWPNAVWKTIKPVLDCVSITSSQGDAIAGLLYTHAWQPDDEPWTASWLDIERFSGLVQRVMGRYGLPTTACGPEFECQLSLESGKVRAALANHGRVALGEARCALDEYLLACRCDDATPPATLKADSAEPLSVIAKRTADASHVEADGTRIEAQQVGVDGAGEPTYIPYPKAMKMLQDSLGATPAELAVWVSFGDTLGCGGIAAFLEANIKDSPGILRFDCWSEADFDYIAPLMGAWFAWEDILSFQPINRYIDYLSLLERWRTSKNVPNVASYIDAKVREGRLNEVHPVTGFSQLSCPDDEDRRPAKETTLLDLADVERIETVDGLSPDLDETPDQRRQRLNNWLKEEKASNPRGAVNRVAKREGISRQRVSQIIERG